MRAGYTVRGGPLQVYVPREQFSEYQCQIMYALQVCVFRSCRLT